MTDILICGNRKDIYLKNNNACYAQVILLLNHIQKSSSSYLLRGTNGPGGWVLRDIPGEPNKTEFIWLLNTKLGVSS